MCIKIMVPARMVLGLARIVAATHGFWTMKMMPLARETAIGNIAAIVVRQRQKPFIPAVTTTATVRGRNTPPPSTGVKATAGIAVTAAMTTLLIA